MLVGGPRSATSAPPARVFGLMGALLVLALKVAATSRGILTWLGVNFVDHLPVVQDISWQGHLGGSSAAACGRRGPGLRAARPAPDVVQVAGLLGVALLVVDRRSCAPDRRAHR